MFMHSLTMSMFPVLEASKNFGFVSIGILLLKDLFFLTVMGQIDFVFVKIFATKNFIQNQEIIYLKTIS